MKYVKVLHLGRYTWLSAILFALLVANLSYAQEPPAGASPDFQPVKSIELPPEDELPPDGEPLELPQDETVFDDTAPLPGTTPQPGNRQPVKSLLTGEAFEQTRNPNLYERVQTLIMAMNFSKEELLSISPRVNKIALYRNADKQNKMLPAKIYELIENGLTRKLLETGRFQIFECMECKSTQLILKENTFTILRAVESNQRLAEIAKNIKVDGFFLWNVYVENDKLFLNFKVVDAKTGEVVWARKFQDIFEEIEEEKELRPYEVALETGIWGYKYERKSATLPAEHLDKVATLSLKVLRESKNSKHIIYGVGLDYFANIVRPEFFDIAGGAFYGHLILKLDKIFFSGEGYEPVDEKNLRKEYFSTWNYYVSLGEALFMKHHTEIYKSGLTLRFSERFSFSLGFVNIPEKRIELVPIGDFESHINFGGTTYEVGIGFVF
ncbi:MAG: hypothetical protein OEY64_09440 [Nitrospinota bacterium]|nr:hypothetical protein [Nitrospinota bacterium]